MTVDETWVRYYVPENKAQSRQREGPGSLRLKKFNVQPSAGKVMASVFWDAHSVIMLDFLAKKSTITGAYYANLLDQLRTVIREKRRGKLSKGILLQQDNARVHTCKIAMDAVEQNGYELIPHPAYSPDLAPSGAGLGGSVGCAVRLETRRSRVQPPPGSATFFRGD